MDLAYLNAGAGKTDGSSISDVDVNYDNSIDLKDLEKMDAQWGESLHANQAITDGLFGTGDSTINLTAISLGGDYGTADNSAFTTQNSTENTTGFVDTLAGAGSAGYSDGDFSAPYGELHDASTDTTQ